MTVGPFDLPPKEAVAFLRSKGLRITDSWRDMWRDEHDAAFTVAKMADMDLLRQVHQATIDAVEQGTTIRDFRQRLEPVMQEAGWWGKKTVTDEATGEQREVQLGSPRRLRTIFRTNLQTAYAAGHYAQIQETKDDFPYLMYDAVDDDRTRPEHATWDGTVLPVDHEWWQTHYPPNGFNCRCSVIQLSEEDLARMGKSVPEAPPSGPPQMVPDSSGEVDIVPHGVDPGWDYPPGAAMIEKAGDLMAGKLESADEPMAQAALRYLVNSPAFESFYEDPRGNFPVMRISEEQAEAMGAERRVAVISAESMQKNKDHHPELSIDDYRVLPDFGESAKCVIQVSDEKIIVIKIAGQLYFSVVKTTKSGKATYLVSFRKTNADDVRWYLNRGVIISGEWP